MRNHVRHNVVGYVALFFALSLGTAYAIDKNSVKSKHIGAGQVKTADLGNAAVTNAKLATNSVDGDNVVDDSLKGADVDESSLNIPQPDIPSTLPPSGAAGGDLLGQYPDPQVSESGLVPGGDLTGTLANAQLGGNSVGANEVDGSLTGADIANVGNSDDVNANAVDGFSAPDLVARDSNQSATGATSVGFFSYVLGTGTANVYEFGRHELRTTAVAGQIMVCSNASTLRPYVIYVNGVGPTAMPGDANNACNDTFTVGTAGEFQIYGSNSIIFGTQSAPGGGGTSDDYYVIGFN